MPEEFTVQVQGESIQGRFYRPTAESTLAVLFLHGWTGRPNDRAALFLQKHGFAVLTFAMRGHVGSEGDIQKITAGDSLADAIAAYDFLQQQVGDGVTIVVVGNSYGGYIAALLSRVKQLHGLSLRVPAGYRDEDMDLPKYGNGHANPEVMSWRRRLHGYQANQGFGALHDFKGYVQIIEAGQDELVPHETVQSYIHAVSDKSKLEYRLMKNWPHSLGDDPTRNTEYQTILRQWLDSITQRR
jgi:esterase/lipase